MLLVSFWARFYACPPPLSGFLEFKITEVPVPEQKDLKDDEVLVRIEAVSPTVTASTLSIFQLTHSLFSSQAPINPSDIGPLFAPTYGAIGRFDGTITGQDKYGRSVTSIPIPEKTMKVLKSSKIIGRNVRVGNEGAGRVIAAGGGVIAQSLRGKLVACMGMGGSYAQHAVVNVANCMPHHDSTTVEGPFCLGLEAVK